MVSGLLASIYIFFPLVGIWANEAQGMMAPPFCSDDGVFRPAVVAPTFNNGQTVGGIQERLNALGLHVFAVNDGSTDQTAHVLEQWARGDPARRVLTHEGNRGKAAALHTGFRSAAAEGFTHAVTIDTDGQLEPEDIPTLLAAAQRRPDCLVIGRRDASAADYPLGSRVGRRLSNLMIFLESGLKVADSQCGLRVYPLALVRAVACRAGHFGFETEIITQAGWAGYGVISRTVACTYAPRPERISHFKPWLDTPRAVRMHARLLVMAARRRWARVMPTQNSGVTAEFQPIGPVLQTRVGADGSR
jgi:hypothetical protein